MRTEARRKYSRGFVLNEQELRRIHDVVDQQMKRLLSDTSYETSYEVRYRNGAIAEPTKLDEIFGQENWGSAAIRLVSLTCREKTDTPKTKITVRFADPDGMDEKVSSSIFYEIEGEDRDWVFVASSQLSERIARVERFNMASMDRRTFTSILTLVPLVGMLVGILFVRDPAVGASRVAIHNLRDDWKSGALRDPVDAMLRSQEVVLEILGNRYASGYLILPMLIGPVTLLAAVIGGALFVRYAFPAYNFVWGEYQREYEKRRGRVRFIGVGILLTVALGIIANLVTKRIGF